MMQQQAVPTGRPGQMTAVMRAVSHTTGPKILRIGVVQGGRVVDERLIKERSHVTIGPSEKAMFVVPQQRLPHNFRLFELIGGEYYLNYLETMTGRVALQTGVSDLVALKAQAKTLAAGDIRFHRVKLSEDSRGKIVVGDVTFLFQFVVAPPPQPKPQLPVSVRKGLAGDIDWFTTIVAAFSFLFHFFFVALVYSDWMDPVVDDEATVSLLMESIKKLPPPPPMERPVTDAEIDPNATQAADATDKGKGGGDKAGGGGGRKGPGDGKAAADAKAAELASELAELDVQTLGALGGGGVATDGVLGTSDVPMGLLDDAARSGMGAGIGGAAGLRLGGSGGGAVRPGAGGGGGDLSKIGVTQEDASSGAAKAGTAKAVAGPKGSVSVGGAGVSGGAVANASSVVARMRARFRHCYEQGLNSNPEMQGTVTLTAKVGPNGEVQSVGGGGGGSLSPIVGCLKAVVAGAQFAPPDGGGAIITIPISFVRQN